jgi:hypothetical protein
MTKKSDKQILFEKMNKVGGMPLKEDMYTNDQVTQNLDKWHNPEQGPDVGNNNVNRGISNEEFISSMEDIVVKWEKTLNTMDSNDPNYKFIENSLNQSKKVLANAKKQAGVSLNEEVASEKEIQQVADILKSDFNIHTLHSAMYGPEGGLGFDYDDLPKRGSQEYNNLMTFLDEIGWSATENTGSADAIILMKTHNPQPQQFNRATGYDSRGTYVDFE